MQPSWGFVTLYLTEPGFSAAYHLPAASRPESAPSSAVRVPHLSVWAQALYSGTRESSC